MKVTEIVASVLKVDASTINMESNAQNTPRWDSLRHIELVLAIESRFGVQFSIPEIVSMQKLGDIVDLLTNKGADVAEADQRA
ncbi:MAG: acyl carrier protein, partial [Pseudomonadota bacterium]